MGGAAFRQFPSPAFADYNRQFNMKQAPAMTEGVKLIRKSEGEIIHPKDCSECSGMATVRCPFLSSFTSKLHLVQLANRNCGEGLLTIRVS